MVLKTGFIFFMQNILHFYFGDFEVKCDLVTYSWDSPVSGLFLLIKIKMYVFKNE